MPELPEVQTVVNHIKDDLVGEKIKSIIPLWAKVLHNFTPNDVVQKLERKIVVDVYRRAKFIIIQFNTGIIAIHLRMTGKLYFLSKNDYPKHCTAYIEFESGKKLIFEDVRKFGRWYLYEDLDPINDRHGPEPLDDTFTVQKFQKMLFSRKRNIKSILLDQSFLSGLGNIYVDESLWKSKIHPNSISNSIPKKRIEMLFHNIRKTLRDAIDNKGTTIIDFSVNGESGKYTNELKVFGRTGQECFHCSQMIKKSKVTGRGTYTCNKCQKKYYKTKK